MRSGRAHRDVCCRWLVHLEQENFNVLLSDIGMPDEDGYWLIRQLRFLPHDRGGQTPAIALTAYARAPDKLASGFQDYLSKPVEPAELATAVARVAGTLERR